MASIQLDAFGGEVTARTSGIEAFGAQQAPTIAFVDEHAPAAKGVTDVIDIGGVFRYLTLHHKIVDGSRTIGCFLTPSRDIDGRPFPHERRKELDRYRPET